MADWKDALILEEGEILVDCWAALLKKGGEAIKTTQNKSTRGSRLVLTNRRLEYLGKAKLIGGKFEFLFAIPLESIEDLLARTTGKKYENYVDIRTAEGMFEAQIVMHEKGIKGAALAGAKEGFTFGAVKSDKNILQDFIQKVFQQIKNRRQELAK
jgi:hypothetical protein